MSSDEMSDINVSVIEDNVKKPVGHKALQWVQDQLVRLAAAVRTQDNAEHVEAFDQVDIDWDSIALKVGYPANECQQKWKALVSNVRQFRTLSEVATDVLIDHSKMNLKHAEKSCFSSKTFANHTGADGTNKSKKLKKNPDHPKKPSISGYNFFCSQKMKMNSNNLKGSDLMTEVSKKWHVLPKQKKDKYNLLSKKENEEYLEKLRTYVKDHPEDEEIKKIISAAENKKLCNTSRKIKGQKRKHSKSNLSETLNESIQEHSENEMDPSSPYLRKRPTKKRARTRFTAEDAYVKEKVESYKLKNSDYKQEKVDTKLHQKFAKMSESKKEKYHQMAANMTGGNAN